MKFYRVIIKPISSFSSQLQSDTLFGAFCWSYKYSYGEEVLERMLREMEEGNVQLIFSNAFPTGTLPLPLGVYDQSADFENLKKKADRKRAYQQHKKLKSAKYIQKEWFEKVQRGDCCGFTNGLKEDIMHGQSTVHNMVSRDTGIVGKTGEAGNLFEEDEFFVGAEDSYDVYILSSLDAEVLKNTIKLMCFLGIGKNKSVGKGAFQLLQFCEEHFDKAKSNAFMALSNFVPAKNDPIVGRYKTLVKYGKLDREYASGEIPFKKPILFFQAGAVFMDEEVRPFYGRCIKNISAIDNVVTNAYTIAVPMWINL